MLRVAMLSKWHVHAEGYAKMLLDSGKVEIKAVWDDDAARGSAWAQSLGVDFYESLDELLKRDDIDAVICDAPTTAHKDVIIAAANAGKHIFTEKALCPTVADCLEVKEAIERAKVTFVISYPMLQTPTLQFAKKAIMDGAFGRISTIRIRNGHSGVSGHWLPAYWFEEKDAAGGAMMDLGCHPMYTLAYLGGKPKRVTGLFNAPFGSKVDENAVATVEFENGILGIGETSFISHSSPDTIEIYGTDGTLISFGGEVKFASKSLGVNGFTKPELPAAKPLPLLQFVDACIDGTGSPEGLGIDNAIALTELLEKAYIADRSNSYAL